MGKITGISMIEYIESSEDEFTKLRRAAKSDSNIKGNYCYILKSGLKIYRVNRIKA